MAIYKQTHKVGEMDKSLKTQKELEQENLASDKTPSYILYNVYMKEFLSAKIRPKDLSSIYLPTDIDIEELRRKFSKFCDDYGKLMDPKVGSKAVGFCLRIINIVGPEARQFKKTGLNKLWKFLFSVLDTKEDKIVDKEVHVSVRKMETRQCKENILRLTVQEASLLALTTFNQHVIHLYETWNIVVLTPGARDVFSENVVCEMSKELGLSVPEVICIINSSCQVGGHVVEDSRGDCALVAAIIAIRRMKNIQIKDGIINRVFMQYVNKKKIFDNDKFVIFLKYAHGGIAENIGQISAGLKSITLNNNSDNQTRFT